MIINKQTVAVLGETFDPDTFLFKVLIAFLFPVLLRPIFAARTSLIEVSRSHSDTPHTVGILWTSDHPDAETSNSQYTAVTRDKHLCPRPVANSQSQQTSGRRRTPARTATEVDHFCLVILILIVMEI